MLPQFVENTSGTDPAKTFSTPHRRKTNRYIMKTKSIIQLIGASAVALFCTACESKQEEAREQNLEQKADQLENAADATRKQGEKMADSTEKATEGKADAIEKEADKVREQK